MSDTSRPRILHIDFSGYGVMTHVLSILDNADHDRWEHCVLYAADKARPGVDSYKTELADRSIRGWAVPVCRDITAGDLIATSKTWKLLGEIRPAIVHCHSTKAGAIGRFCAALRGRLPTVYTPNSFSFQMAEPKTRKRSVLTAIERLLGKVTGRLIAVSQTEYDLAIREGITGADATFLIPNGVNIPQMDAAAGKRVATRQALNLSDSEPVVCFSARLAPQKMPEVVIKAAAALKSKGLSPTFLFIGGGPLEADCRDLITQLQVEENVRLLGWKPYDEALSILAASDVMVLPSRYEGLPLAALEAQAVGAVPILTQVPGSQDAIKDGETGVFVPFNDPEALGAAIQKLLLSPEQRAAFAAAGKKHIQSRYNAALMAQSVEALYGEFLKRGAADKTQPIPDDFHASSAPVPDPGNY